MNFFSNNIFCRKTGFYLGFFLMFFVFICSFFLCAQINPLEAQVDYPDYSSFVNDYTGVMGDDWRSKTEEICVSVENQTGAEIAVAVIDSLQGITVEEFAVELFEKWGIGKAAQDNGVLLLVAIQDRKLRIEVGYGLEGAITDLEASDIIDGIIVPEFKNSNYGSGIYDGVAAIASEIYKEYGIAEIGRAHV